MYIIVFLVFVSVLGGGIMIFRVIDKVYIAFT